MPRRNLCVLFRGQSNLNVSEELAGVSKVRWLLSRRGPQPLAAALPSALSAEPCRWLPSSSSSYLRHSNGQVDTKPLASPPLKDTKVSSFQKKDSYSVLSLFLPRFNSQSPAGWISLSLTSQRSCVCTFSHNDGWKTEMLGLLSMTANSS